MNDSSTADIGAVSTERASTKEASSEPQRPTFRGCMFCYSAEWALFAGKKAYRRLSE